MIATLVEKSVSIRKAQPRIKELKICLKYKNQAVVLRFTKLFSVTEKQANEIFKNCIRWLWLCATAASDRREGSKVVPEKLAIDNSVLIIDEMWHNFLCFTKAYHEFCFRHFGFFVHHNPTSKRFNDSLRRKMTIDISFQKKRREVQYQYTVAKLGIRVFKKWYIEYDKEFTPKKIKQLRLT